MVIFTCEKCAKLFNNKTDYTRHVAMHGRKEENLTNIKPEVKLEKIHAKPETCVRCGKGFQNKYTLKLHMEKNCKFMVVNMMNDLGKNKFALHNKIAQMDNKLEQIYEFLKEKELGTIQNIINIENIGRVSNNNVYVNSYGNEGDITNILSNSQMKKVISQGGNAISRLINFKHYNPQLPENHNMILNRIKDDKMLIFTGDNFEEMMTDEIILDLIAKSYTDIYNILKIIESELDEKEKRNIQRLIYKIEQNNDDTKTMINEELRKLMFKNREIIRKTIQNATKTYEENDSVKILTI